MSKSYAILILAAGKSSRMGACKLEISYDGKTILEHTMNAACNSKADQIVVVSGAFPKVVEAAAINYNLDVVHNDLFESGMASSIQVGLNYILKNYKVDGIIISVADQYYLKSKIFNDLMEKHGQEANKIIVSTYKDTMGVPCLFPRTRLHLLDELTGDYGAKKIFKDHLNLLCEIPFPEGWFDLDSPSDLINLDLDEDKTGV